MWVSVLDRKPTVPEGDNVVSVKVHNDKFSDKVFDAFYSKSKDTFFYSPEKESFYIPMEATHFIELPETPYDKNQRKEKAKKACELLKEFE